MVHQCEMRTTTGVKTRERLIPDPFPYPDLYLYVVYLMLSVRTRLT